MARISDQMDVLIEAAKLDLEPSVGAVRAAHVRRDGARSDFLVEIAISPRDADRAGGRARLNKSPSGKLV